MAGVTELEYAPCKVIGPKDFKIYLFQKPFYLTKIGPNAMQGAYSKPCSTLTQEFLIDIYFFETLIAFCR